MIKNWFHANTKTQQHFSSQCVSDLTFCLSHVTQNWLACESLTSNSAAAFFFYDDTSFVDDSTHTAAADATAATENLYCCCCCCC